MARAPSDSQTRHFSSLPAVAKTGCQRVRDLYRGDPDTARSALHQQASFPALAATSRPRSKTLLQTVKKVSGSAAASVTLRGWQKQALGQRRGRILRVAAAGEQRADFVARFQVERIVAGKVAF